MLNSSVTILPADADLVGMTSSGAARWNARSSLCRLPNELLVRIAQDLVHISREQDSAFEVMCRLASVCGLLRSVFVNMPTLWTEIDFQYNSDVLDLMESRSHGAMLVVTFAYITFKPCDFLRLVRYYPRIISLHLTILSKETFDSAFQELHGAAATHLTTLEITTAVRPLQVSRALLALGCIPAGLSDAIFGGFLITGMAPPMLVPSLRTLRLWECFFTVQDLRDFLATTPSLEHLELDHLHFNTVGNDDAVTARAELPALRCLIFKCALECTAELLSVIPNPSTTFTVTIYKNGLPPSWSRLSQKAANALIMSRLLQFWTAVTNATMLPTGTVHVVLAPSGMDRVCQYVSFGTEVLHGTEPEVFYCAPWFAHEHDPFVVDIRTLRLESNPSNSSRPRPYTAGEGPDYDHFPDIDTFAAVNVDLSMSNGLKQRRLRALKTWITSRCTRGRPLQSIEFDACTNAQWLYDELLDGPAAGSIAWNGVSSIA
jgi:hypothetical protein